MVVLELVVLIIAFVSTVNALNIVTIYKILENECEIDDILDKRIKNNVDATKEILDYIIYKEKGE